MLLGAGLEKGGRECVWGGGRGGGEGTKTYHVAIHIRMEEGGRD